MHVSHIVSPSSCTAMVRDCAVSTSCSITNTTSISLCTLLTQLICTILSFAFFHCFDTPIAEFFATIPTLFPLRDTIHTVAFDTSRAVSQLIIPIIIFTVITKAIVIQALMTSVGLHTKICLTPRITTDIHPKT